MFRHHVLAALVLSAFAQNSQAQAPTLNPPFPVGVQRGTTLELTLAGANLAEPVAVVTSFPAKVTIPMENNNGKDAAKFIARLEVPKDAPLGWHSIRVMTRRGLSNLRQFCIDDLPQVLEADTNRAYATAQLVPLPCVVCGRADSEVTDYFKFIGSPGQRLSFEVLGRRLGSQLDPYLVLYHGPTKKQIAFSDDAPGQLKDARFSHTFKEGGEYVLELRDVRYQGGADWYYRLRIGDFPLATTMVPLAGKRGTTVDARFAGPHVDGLPPLKLSVPSDLSQSLIHATPSWANGPAGWPVPFFASEFDEGVEVEPNDDPAKANRVQVPGAMNARFEKKGEKDCFVLTGKKGQRLIIAAHTQDYNSPTSVYMVLQDAKGVQLAVSDPAKDPARIDYTPAADGDCTLVVEHLHYWGGPAETYRLTFQVHEPGFGLSIAADHVDVPQGATALLTVQAARRDYSGPIELSVVSPAGVKGTATIAANQPTTLLALTADAGMPVGGGALVLAGKATVGGRVVTEHVSIRTPVAQALGNLPVIPPQLESALAVGIVEKPPFTIEAKYDLSEGVRGLSVPVTITAAKAAGFDEEITITSVGLPPAQGQQPAFPPVTVKIAKGQKEVKAELKPAAGAPLGQLTLAFVGKGKANNIEHSTATPVVPVTLVLPFELHVDTASGKLAVNGKHTLKVRAIRKGGYKGPISLEVRNLPANVTAAKVTIAENQDAAEIELTAAANAAVGDKNDVNILGTASAAANQQNASANFMLSVAK
jgi:hypothetical protein